MRTCHEPCSWMPDQVRHDDCWGDGGPPNLPALISHQRDFRTIPLGRDDQEVGPAVGAGAAEDVVAGADLVFHRVAGGGGSCAVPVEDALEVLGGGEGRDADAAAVPVVRGAVGDLR